MKKIDSRPIPTILFVLLLGLAGSCGDEPQRIGKSEPAPVSPHPTMSTSPQAAMPVGTVLLAGHVELAGSLASVQSGAVFMIARSGGRTALVHKYDMSGPSWSKQGDARVLTFSLSDQDNMGGVGAPVGAKMDLEARYDPDGFVDTKPGTEKKGVFKAFTSAAVGDAQISLKLDPAAQSEPVAPSGNTSGSILGKPSGG